MRKLLLMFFISLAIIGCKEDIDENPYDLPQNQPPVTEEETYTANPNSIAGLHKNIFKPVCANSGCHDGTFEPDFRTIESAYNMLVLQPVIKNNPAGTFDFRVVPGQPDASVLISRLMIDIDGQSGIMPLAVDAGSDWETKKAEYIQNVRTWILNGAKDMFGNGPTSSNLQPQLSGVFITVSGNAAPLPRNVQSGAVVVPEGTASIDVYFSFSDDATPINELGYLKCKTGASLNDFSGFAEMDLLAVAPVSQNGYSGGPVSYTHKVTLNCAGLPALQQQFLRVYLQDGPEAIITEVPRSESAGHIKRYYSFQVGEP